MTRTTSLVALVALAVTAVACGDDDASPASSAPTPSPTNSGTSTVATGGEFNDADVAFAQAMVPHHVQAIEMAELALDKRAAASNDVRSLASAVIDAQSPEVAQLKGWLEEWGQPVATSGHDGHGTASDQGMMTDEQMTELEAASGSEFDRMWLEMMIAHHEGAIATARDVQGKGVNPGTTRLTEAVIVNQQAEITELKRLLEQ